MLESNFVVSSKVLKEFGAFDESIREHDIQPLAAKLAKAGITNLFTNRLVVVRHNDTKVRPYNRLTSLLKAEFYVARTYIGMRRYFFPWWR